MADESRSAASEQSQATATKGDSRPVYEIGYHLVPTIAVDDVAAEADKVRALLGDAEIIKSEVPAKFRLAYIIERAAAGRREKYAESYFGFIKFAIDKEAIPAIEQGLRANRSVLRHLLIETVREDGAARRAVFTSDRLEGETIHKPESKVAEEKGEVSEEELNKSIDALVS
jgi:ribosomal protein S6